MIKQRRQCGTHQLHGVIGGPERPISVVLLLKELSVILWGA
jgi:hypothetical protein